MSVTSKTSRWTRLRRTIFGRPSPAVPSTCPNCDRTGDEGIFCPICGMDKSKGRLKTGAVLAETANSLVGLDSALRRTLRDLIRRPGSLIEDYVAGRRRKYVNPARFCLLSLGLWFVVAGLCGLEALEISGIRISSNSDTESSARIAGRAREIIGDRLELLLFLALPIRAACLQLLFRRSGRNLAESLVLVLYVAGFGYLLAAAMTPISVWVGGGQAIAAFRGFVAILWTVRIARDFYGTSWFGATWRSLAVAFLHVLGTVVFFASIVVPWILLTEG